MPGIFADMRSRLDWMPIALVVLMLSQIPATAQRGPVPGLNSATPYLIHYGDWTPALVTEARMNYRLVILAPSTSNITSGDIGSIRSGPNELIGDGDDVKVLAYISVGEDDRPGAPFVGDGLGPRIDPRANPNQPLAGIAPLGVPSPLGGGYASYYLDDNDLNGFPDQNSIFGGFYVNPGDPAWYQVLKNNRRDVEGRSGLLELLTPTTGYGFNCDGLFLDTLDTPAPNSFGATQFEWTTKAYRDLVKQIGDEHPDKLLLANRGVFFYNPNLKSYAFTLRPYINLLMFESYYTDSSGSGAATAYFADNKFNYAPKINAEANRPDGFTVLGLGYTTPGESSALIAQDFLEVQQAQGWLLYRTNPTLTAVPFNTQAAMWNAAHPDVAPPVWDSTAATDAQPPPSRVGLQEVVTASGSATLRWDVARDQTGPVRYNIYVTDTVSFDFATAIKIPHAVPVIPESYLLGTGAGRYPHEFQITGLTNGITYRFAVRAEDALGHEDLNTVVLNAVPQSNPATYAPITIDGNFSDWATVPVLAMDPAEGAPVDFANVQVANDANFLYVRFTLHAAAAAFGDFNTHLFLDTDNNPATGFAVSGAGIGSEMMIESGVGYDQRNGSFNQGGVNGVAWSISPAGAASAFELRLSRAATYANGGALVFPTQTLRLALQDNRGEVTQGILLDFATAPPPPPAPSNYAEITVDGNASDWAAIPVTATDAAGEGTPDIVSLKVANDADYLYILVNYNGTVNANTFGGSPSSFLSIDNDANTATGFNVYGLGQVGAEVSWQNDYPFVQGTGNFNLGATLANAGAGIAPYNTSTSFQEYRIARNATYQIGAGPVQAVFPNQEIKLAFWTDHATSAEFAGAVRYAFATPPPAGNFTNISIDGSFADWETLPVRATRASTGASLDWASLKLANDSQYLYGKFTLHQAPLEAPFTSYQTNLFLDADANPGTGFHPGGSTLGSSLLIQGGSGYDQRGGGFNEGPVTGLGWLIAGAGTEWEFRIARSAAYAGAAPVFSNAAIRLLLQDDRPAPSGTLLNTAGTAYTFQPNPLSASYQAWLITKFTATELSNPSISGSQADPDADGLINLLEFALNLPPHTPSQSGLPRTGIRTVGANRHLTFTYTRRPASDGVTYTPQTSTDLQNWNPDPAQFVPVSTTQLPGGLLEIELRLAAPFSFEHRFVRLRVGLALP